MSDDTIKFSIDKGMVEPIINAHVKKAIVAALSENPEYFIDRMVSEVINTKRSPYDRETIFDETVRKVMLSEIEATFKRWVEDNRPMIKEAVQKRLERSKGGIFVAMTEKIMDAMSSNIRLDLTITDKDCEKCRR